MNFSWNDSQLALKEKVIAFSQTLNEDLSERDQKGKFSLDLWQRCADFGILKLYLPKQYGGDDNDLLTTVLAMESMGYGCRDNGLLLALNEQIWCIQQPLLMFGNDRQKQTYLTAIGKGEMFGTQAISEALSGSDALSMQTTATRSEGGYILNGEKAYIGLAPVAHFSLVFARTDLKAGQWGVSLFIVHNDSKGCRIVPKDKMGTRTNPLGSILFKDCFVKEENRVGNEGIGISVFSQTMDWERSFILASYVGSMAYQLDQTIEFAKHRHQYGQPIGQYQSISNRIADMKSRLEIARLLLYKQAWQKQQGVLNPVDSAIAKLHISEAFLKSSEDAVRIHGARGYLSESGIERDLRDAIGSVIYAGTSDIQRNIIAKLLGLS